MKLHTFYVLAALTLLSWSTVVSADSIAHCERYTAPRMHNGQRYNVRCDFNRPQTLIDFANTIQYKYTNLYSGAVTILPYTQPNTTLQFGFYNARLKLMNSECASRHVNAYMLDNVNAQNYYGVMLADCPNTTENINMKLITDAFVSAVRSNGNVNFYRYYDNVSIMTFVNPLSQAASGNGGGNPTSPSQDDNVVDSYWSLNNCIRQCENTGVGVCQKRQGGGKRFYCIAD